MQIQLASARFDTPQQNRQLESNKFYLPKEWIIRANKFCKFSAATVIRCEVNIFLIDLSILALQYCQLVK